MQPGAAPSFGAQLKALRERAGFTQEELATIAGLSVHAISALERGERRRPHVETVRALSAALDLSGATRDRLVASARAPAHDTALDEFSRVSLPLAPTALLGRDADVEVLRRWVADPAARLITLVGPGGVGKTRLALELAHWIAEQGSARVVFVPLAAIRESVFVVSGIAEALGMADVAAQDLPMRARLACHDGPTWIVLDNFEQVLAAAPLVADLLKTVAPLRFLATSRAALRLRGEREYVVGPLTLELDSEVLPPADLARAPAVRLFVERVRDVQPQFRLTAANGPTVAAICRRLDALPLALELAAPWIKVLNTADLLRRLEQDVLLSTVGPRDLPERQRTMNATIAWSYDLLTASEQQVFRRLGALSGRFSIDAAAAVVAGAERLSARSDEVLGAVATLIDKSLLLRAESAVANRALYRMLETVRAYAALELAAVGERDDAREGLTRYCTREAALVEEGLNGSAQAEWLDRVRDDLDNYRAAMSALIECGRPGEASDIAFALKYFWMIRGHAAEGLRWYEQILGAPSLSPGGESRALVGAAGMWFAQGELERARPALDRALALAGRAGDAEIVAEAEYTFGHLERAVGHVHAARDRFTTSLEAYRALNRLPGAGKALIGLAALALITGDAAAAERLVEEAASVMRDDAPWFRSFGLWMRALLAVRRGNADEAIGLARESLVLIRELKDKFAFVYALVPLAAAAALKGGDAWAARILGMRDAVAERTGAMLLDRSVQNLRAQAERDVRARLGDDRWARAYAAGRVTSIDSLIQDIDRELKRSADS
jgi:predicted ATPase/DNA-binding XRE family transcriptional regulator